ncbi:hypothetical protein [Rubripirellula tenax]|uniref:hypothetical protein n=1 Tax=Rubripirellula tenax TaxID=2528015 RepID=UPI001FE643F8
MNVVVHHGVGQAVNGKNAGQELQSLPNPLTSMLKGLPRDRIISAQESPPDTALDAVNDLNLGRIKNLATSKPGHKTTFRKSATVLNRRNLAANRDENKASLCLSLFAFPFCALPVPFCVPFCEALASVLLIERFGDLLKLAVEIDLGKQLIESIVKGVPRSIDQLVSGHPERVLM